MSTIAEYEADIESLEHDLKKMQQVHVSIVARWQKENQRLREALQKILGKPTHTNEPLIGNQLIAKQALEQKQEES